MALTAKVEWWKEGLSPEGAIEAWATAATMSVILAVLLEEKLADGSMILDEKGVPVQKNGGKDK
jgi:hypothetical protein